MRNRNDRDWLGDILLTLLVIGVIVCVAPLSGCGSSKPASRPSDEPSPASSPTEVVSVVVVQPQHGTSTTYEVTPEKQGGDKYVGIRSLTWAGDSPNSVVKSIETAKASHVQNPLPAVNLDEKGIHAAAGGGSVDKQEGVGWFSLMLDAVWNFLKSILGWLLLLGIVAAVLFTLTLIPATAPIAAPIFHGLLAILTGGLSLLASLVTRIRGVLPARKIASEVIDGGEAFKAALAADTTLSLTPAQKDGIKAMFRTAQMGAQDHTTQTAVKAATA